MAKKLLTGNPPKKVLPEKSPKQPLPQPVKKKSLIIEPNPKKKQLND